METPMETPKDRIVICRDGREIMIFGHWEDDYTFCPDGRYRFLTKAGERIPPEEKRRILNILRKEVI